MKHLILTFTALLSITCFGQIALDHSYAGISRYHFTTVNIDNIGYKYLSLDDKYTSVELYNLDHTTFKSIPVSVLPTDSSYFYADVFGVSQHIFDNDDDLEILFDYGYRTFDDKDANVVLVLNDDGSELFSVNDASLSLDNNINNGQFLFFTEDGIKLSVLKSDTIAQIYSLPGNYRPAIAENTLKFTNDTLYVNNNKVYLGDYMQKLSLSNDTLYLTDGGWVYIGTNNGTSIEGIIESPDNQVSNIYPNPTDKKSVVLRYSLPENVQDGALNIYGINGNLVRTISLEPTKSLEEINISFLSAGTYLYQVESSAGHSNLNKLIVY